MESILLDTYKVKLELTRDMLGTNPQNLDVMDKHIIDRQRKLIAENSKINKAVNKYLGAKDITDEEKEKELKALQLRTEEVLGRPLEPSEVEAFKQGDLKQIADLKETMTELDAKGITCFFRNPDGQPNTETGRRDICIGDHMILGFLKSAAEAISKTRSKKSGAILHSASYTTTIINQHVATEPEFISASQDIKREEDGTPVYLQRSLRAMTMQGPRVSLAKSEVLPAGTTFEFTLRILKDSPLKEEHLQELFSYGAIKGLGQWRNKGCGQFKVIELTRS